MLRITVVILIPCSLTFTDFNRMPYGPVMCMRFLCLFGSGYRGGLDVDSLNCQVVPSTAGDFQSGDITYVQSEQECENTCQGGQSVVITRQKSKQCIQIPDEQIQSSSEQGKLPTVNTNQSNVTPDYHLHSTKRQPEKDTLGSSWKKVLETGSHGNVTFGTRKLLLHCVSKAAKIRVYLHGRRAAYQLVNIIKMPNTSLTKDGPHFCGQTARNLGIRPRRGIYISTVPGTMEVCWICTTGSLHVSVNLYSVSDSYDEYDTNDNMTWFACGPDTEKQFFQDKNENGKVVLSGKQLVVSMENGNGVTIIGDNSEFYYPCPITESQHRRVIAYSSRNFQVGSQDVVSRNRTTVPQFKYTVYGSNKVEFRLASYSFRPSSHRKQIKNVRKTHTFDVKIDTGWQFAFLSKKSQNVYRPLPKTKLQIKRLVSAVRRGHRVKVVSEHGSSREGDILSVYEDEDLNLSSTSVYKVVSNSRRRSRYFYWSWMIVNTDSWVTEKFHRVHETRIAQKQRHRKGNFKWYVDTGSWVVVLQLGPGGHVKTGTVPALRHAVMNGAEVRIGLSYQKFYTHYKDAENIYIGPDGTVHATLTPIPMSASLNTRVFKIKTKPRPLWEYFSVTSDGVVTVVRHEHAGQKYDVSDIPEANITWFVMY